MNRTDNSCRNTSSSEKPGGDYLHTTPFTQVSICDALMNELEIFCRPHEYNNEECGSLSGANGAFEFGTWVMEKREI